MSHEVSPKKRRLTSLIGSGIDYKTHNGKRRRLCSVDGCEKQAQRKTLCARHLNDSNNERKPTRNVTLHHQSSAHQTTEQLEPDSNGYFHLAAVPEVSNMHRTFEKCGEFSPFDNTADVKAFLFFHMIFRKCSTNNSRNTVK